MSFNKADSFLLLSSKQRTFIEINHMQDHKIESMFINQAIHRMRGLISQHVEAIVEDNMELC